MRITRPRGESIAQIQHRRQEQTAAETLSTTTLLNAGEDLVTFQRLAGHPNITTTARYDRRGEHAKRPTVQSLDLPLAA